MLEIVIDSGSKSRGQPGMRRAGGRAQQDSQGGLSHWMLAASSLRTGTQGEQPWG